MSAPRQVVSQVVVVGAGPVGLLLAGDLRRDGTDVLVVERLDEPMTESRAAQLTTRTAELLHERGLAGFLAEAEPEPKSHFGGLDFDVSRVDSPYAGNRKVPQYRTEAALTRRATVLGVELLRSHELTGLHQTGDHVTCELHGPAGKVEIRAQFVVGCDGEDSTVRRLGGFEFPVVPASRQLLRADVTGLDVPDRRFERFEHGLAVAATRGGVTRVMVHEAGRQPLPGVPSFGDVVRSWAKVTGEDISHGGATWVDAFDNTRGQVTRYRNGRVLLAGDAAHRHLPIGGQAINVGLQDAVNLGWKLAATVAGWAPPDLLDTYHDERHPVGARTLETVAAQELLLLGGPEAEALRAVLAELLTEPAVQEYLAGLVSGLDIRYAISRHPRVGTRLHTELLTEGKPVLFAPVAEAEPWASRVRWAPGPDRVLVRPDGYIAWADGDDVELGAALRRWFGEPPDVSSTPDEEL
ncbi:MAG TPA: FAD-dependent monooxygenase [Amycolatopsis sp.]|uniref:FAD-dependent monooxygenase n=1 Tax=Amycolatopsis sp. TaxID=37632 RepID=UPI002B45AED1|nr:FAD-dependent monooxygenase [Amycolatopsis sp.]HKS46580.1 FAD-dependent monooxygenase [Amycolatopsis sp.]